MPRSRSIKTQDQIENPAKNDWTGVKDPSILKEIEVMPSTLETIDFAVYDYINEVLDLSAATNKGFKKVPIIWASTERAFQIKANKELRDSEDTLILPLITLERRAVSKDISKRIIPYANIPAVNDSKGGTIIIARRINQKKTAEFQNNIARRKYIDGRVAGQGSAQDTYPGIVDEKVVYETVTIPLPVWVSATYEISIRTEYQQQMNDLTTPVLRQGGLNSMPRRLERDGHKFEAFIRGSFTNNANTNSLDMTQRNYETTIDLEVLGYLIGDGPNDDRPKIIIRENAVEVKIPREHVIMGDIDEYLDKRGFYRE
tara:strand:+ start:916 stop:1860 length:945 start_codon:yes stop_codon:yes gene_type:complete